MLGHLLGLFLAHRAAQEICGAKRVAADDLRHLHHLLLVDHDAVGLLQDRFDTRIRILEALAFLARHEVGNQVHRTRPVERV